VQLDDYFLAWQHATLPRPFPLKRGREGGGVAFMMSRQRGKLIRNAWNSTQSHPNLRAATVRNCRKSREMLLNLLIRTLFLRISWFIRCKNFILITQGWPRKLNQTERRTKKESVQYKNLEPRNNTKPRPTRKKGLMAVKRWHDRKDFGHTGSQRAKWPQLINRKSANAAGNKK